MNGVKLKFALCLTLSYLLEVSTLFFGIAPELFSRTRYERSRSRLAQTARSMDPRTDRGLDFVAIVNLYGYPAEEHLVTTSDGYKLRIHRIPGSPGSSKEKGKPIVYLQHGILASSDTWILFGPDKDLAYMLANAGYDVWIGNARGNTYSRSHVTLSPNSNPKFWEFSYHEIAMYDIPAIIDYILQETEESSMTYVGHSMGTTISYSLLSMKPEYNDKINLVVSLAPVAFWNRGTRPFFTLLKTSAPLIKNFVESAGIYELFPLTSINGELAKSTCDDGSVLQPLCLNALFAISGFNPKQVNTSVISYIYSYFPAGVSRKTLLHYSQNIITGDFKLYDYGLVQNFATYHKSAPPYYNLSKISAPVILVYGKGDAVVAPGNVYELAKRLPNVVRIEEVPDHQFSHLDFLFSKDIKILLNDHVLSMLKKFRRKLLKKSKLLE